MRIGFLWTVKSPGLYSVAPFDDLYKYVGCNNGNLVFVDALERHFVGDYVRFPWHAPAARINESCDVVVIPSANQLGRHSDLGALAASLSKVTCPIVAIGLGAQARSVEDDVELSEGTAAWLDVLLENGARHGIQNIYTRGPYTTAQIEKLTGAKVQSGGCPSHFLSDDPQLGQSVWRNWTKADLPRGIVVAGGHQGWAEVRRIEHQLIGLMMDPLFPGIYVPQSMGDMIKISRNEFDTIEPEILEQIRRHTTPHYTLDEFKSWANRFARTYYDVPAWSDDLRRHDLAIGARYHGTALALQTAVMGCTVTIDSRTEELCRETGVPCVSAAQLTGPITRTTLKNDLIRFDADRYDALRKEKCGRYLDFVEGCGLRPAPYLRTIAQA